MKKEKEDFDCKRAALYLKAALEKMRNGGIGLGMEIKRSGNGSGWRYVIADNGTGQEYKNFMVQQRYGKSDGSLMLDITFRLGKHSEFIASECFQLTHAFKEANLHRRTNLGSVNLAMRITDMEQLDRIIDKLQLACFYASTTLKSELHCNAELERG